MSASSDRRRESTDRDDHRTSSDGATPEGFARGVPTAGTDITGVWSAAEAGAYLDDAVVPLRLACHTPAGRLWMLSLWFVHRDGSLWCATGADADVVGYLEADGAVAFEVSTNDPPYRGVRGNGEATVRRGDGAGKALLTELLERYLGDTDGPLARRLLADDREEVRIEVEPHKLYSWDFSNRMA